MQELLNDLFEYKDGELIRKVSSRGPNSRVGDSAGTLRPDGRVHVHVEGKNYLRSRLIWILHHGAIPEGLEIDHIDRDRANDRIENLRVATRSQNLHNRKGKGYYWNKRDGYWEAQIHHQGKKINLGYFKCETAARFAYIKAKNKIAEEFSPYVT